MKKNFALIVVVTMMAIATTLQPAPVQAATDIKVTVNQTPVKFPDQKPYLDHSRVLIPTRFVAQSLGGKVEYNSANKTVTIEQSGKTITLKINSSKVTVGSKVITLDVPAKVIKGRTVVPLRFVSEAMGAMVDWNQNKSLVAITTGNITKPISPTTEAGNFQFDPGFTDLAKKLFVNNMKERDGKVTFTVPSGIVAYHNTTTLKRTDLVAGKAYTYTVGKDAGTLLFNYVDSNKVKDGAQKQSEYYFVFLDPSLRGVKDLSKAIVVTDDQRLNEKVGTIATVTALAIQLK
ncbi:copper amine oxidase N-terminal domain-containing protein [Paenibacillus sp. PsM32]|uniref:copper amine oxidase N-terminal domain-containing protein n=1 Tax=Paenibacillus sp. PsM32 TaxID=3030536 RepID=UPI00263AA90B|nr:copper amine oxidase N-terminal domain-containing protein [Paenibacillus sp. PsM32]MDN4617664.1 copper amine oxidase N-terminal domain-containing protein [Paenibacillus sp. PsM32]